MAKIHINIGSNQNRETNISGAIDMLRMNFTQIELSDVYESPAEGFEGDDFYNVGVNANTDLSAQDVNSVLKNIEKHFGRDAGQPKFSSRVIDLDLVFYDQMIDAELNLPRDDILLYAFVLAPLAQLSPQALHPQQGETYQVLWQVFQDNNSFALSQYNINKIIHE